MPNYKFRDPDTGKTITLVGDSPPTEQELEEIFKSTATPTEPPAPSSFISDVGTSAVREAKGIVKGLPAVVGEASKVASILPDTARYPIQRLMGIPSERTALMQDVETAKAIPGGLVQTLVDTAHAVRHPVKSFRQGPIGTTATIASLLFPAARMLRGALPAVGMAGAAEMGTAAKMGTMAGTAATEATPGIGQRVLAKGLRVGVGIPEEATFSRMKNPAAVKTAFSHLELADQVVDSVKNLGEQIKTLSEKAAETLRASPYIEEGAIPKTDVLKRLESARRQIGGAYTPEKQNAIKALKGIEQNLKDKLKSTVSETQIKSLIQELDSNINWGDPSASTRNKALIKLRTGIDKILKDQNPSYKNAMVDVDEAMRVNDKMQSTFGIERETARGLKPSNQTVNKIKSALKEDKLYTQDVLSRFEKLTGEDLTTKIKNANARALFEGTDITPGRYSRGLIGLSAGEMAGRLMGLPPAMGAAMGAAAGAFADIYGRGAAAKIIDVLAGPTMTKYVPILEKAAAKGAGNLAATHALLMKQDAQYAEKMASAKVPSATP